MVNGGGYNVNVGQISVCADGEFDTSEKPAGHVFDFTTDELVAVKTFLIDGGHRRAALFSLREDEDGDVAAQWVAITERIQVRLWSRLDGKAMSEWDWLHIAAYCNDAASMAMKPSVMDHIYGAMQTALLIAREDHDGDVGLVTEEEVRAAIRNTKTIGSGASSASRYSRIAVRLVKSSVAHEMVKDAFEKTNKKLGTVHLESPELLNLDDDQFKFCLAALSLRVNAGAAGRFDAYAKNFFRSARALHTELDLLAEANNTTVDGLNDVNMDVAQQMTMPLPVYAAGRLAKVEFGKEHDPAKDKRRIQDLIRKVAKSSTLTIPVTTVPRGRTGQTASSAQPGAAAEGPAHSGGSVDAVDEITPADAPTRGGAAAADAVRRNTAAAGVARNPCPEAPFARRGAGHGVGTSQCVAPNGHSDEGQEKPHRPGLRQRGRR